MPVVTSGDVGYPEATTEATSGSLSESEALPSSHRGFSLFFESVATVDSEKIRVPKKTSMVPKWYF